MQTDHKCQNIYPVGLGSDNKRALELAALEIVSISLSSPRAFEIPQVKMLFCLLLLWTVEKGEAEDSWI